MPADHRQAAGGRRGSSALDVAPFAVVVVLVAAGLCWSWQGHWRQGLVIAGCALLLGAGMRLVLPVPRAGLLVVRSRLFDVVMLVALGVGITVMTGLIPYTG